MYSDLKKLTWFLCISLFFGYTKQYMKLAEVLEYFETHHPAKNVILLPEHNPTELICEIDPAQDHPELSIAIAAIKESEPHYHHISTETYEVKDGQLTLYVDGQALQLNKGDSYTIKPGQIHYSTGDFTLVKVRSEPGWIAQDHILA